MHCYPISQKGTHSLPSLSGVTLRGAAAPLSRTRTSVSKTQAMKVLIVVHPANRV